MVAGEPPYSSKCTCLLPGSVRPQRPLSKRFSWRASLWPTRKLHERDPAPPCWVPEPPSVEVSSCCWWIAISHEAVSGDTVCYLFSVSQICTVLSQLTLPSIVEMMVPGYCDILIFCTVLVLISESPDLKGKQILVWQLGEKLVSFPADMHLTTASVAPIPCLAPMNTHKHWVGWSPGRNRFLIDLLR